MNQFRLYRAKKDNNGCALSFQLRYLTEKERETQKFTYCLLFFDAVKQIGTDANENATFAWKDPSKITMKLEPTDVGEILAVINGLKDSAKLFHKTDKGNTVMELSKHEKGFAGKVSRKYNEDKTATQYPVYLSHGDASILKVLLERFIVLNFNWV